jgi:hypothetical protein
MKYSFEIPAADQEPEYIVHLGEVRSSPRSHKSVEKCRWSRHPPSLRRAVPEALVSVNSAPLIT